MDKLKAWLQTLTQQQRVLALLLFISVAYFVWTSIWGGYYAQKKSVVNVQVQELQTKIKEVSVAQAKAKALATDPDVLATKKRLDDLRNQLQQISRRLVSSKQMLSQLTGIFEKDPTLKFTHIENMGSTPFSLEAPGQEPDKKGNTAGAGVKPVASFYQHAFEITFEANYFTTENYIKQLENLPGQLYFDNIDYQVQKYPVATISLKVHTISLDEGLIHV